MARKIVVAYIQDRGFNSVLDNVINPSVNKTKQTGLLSRTRALILLDFDLNISFRARKVTSRGKRRKKIAAFLCRFTPFLPFFPTAEPGSRLIIYHSQTMWNVVLERLKKGKLRSTELTDLVGLQSVREINWRTAQSQPAQLKYAQLVILIACS